MTERPDDPRRSAPAVQFNRAPILEVLDGLLPRRGTVLEVGSGSGEHAVYLAARLPGIVWQPSERDPDALASIGAWRLRSGLSGPLPNLHAPVRIDLGLPDWTADVPAEAAYPVALVGINVIQATPWESVRHLFAGAERLLVPDRVLFLYGPFRRGGQHTSMGNAQLDRELRERDPAWGVRDMEAVADLGALHRLTLEEVVRMPNNNLSLVFTRRR
ncbi:MAG: DUF938 domain-containing protein [Alphaproteobacteria bacterium]